MKVLIVSPDINKSGGVANYYKILAERFTHQVEYFTIGSRTDKDGLVNDIKRLFSDYKNFKIKVAQNNYDVIVLNPTFDIKSVIRDGRFITLAQKHSNAKIIVFWRGFFIHVFDKYIKGGIKKIFENIYFKVDAHIVLGSVFKEKLLSIHCPTPIFCETTIVSNDYIKKEKRPVGYRFNILFLARVEKDKGIYEAVEAFKIIKSKYSNAEFTVAGNGFELDSVKQYVEDNKIPGVFFPGDVRGERKKEVFNGADIYLFPSYYEGMPNSVLEAMGMGLPIVTRNVGGLKDFFENGQMGYITDSYNPEEFALLIEKLYTNIPLREKIAALNSRYAENNFLAGNVLMRLENIFETVLYSKKEMAEQKKMH